MIRSNFIFRNFGYARFKGVWSAVLIYQKYFCYDVKLLFVRNISEIQIRKEPLWPAFHFRIFIFGIDVLK